MENVPIICVDLLVKYNDTYLLMLRKNNPIKGKYWMPGGRVYKNESLGKAVKRKCLEECGVKVKNYKKVGVIEYIKEEAPFNNIKSGIHVVSIVYEILIDSKNILMDSQHDDYKWVSFENFPKKLKEMLKGFNL